jgi:hypothetical protein
MSSLLNKLLSKTKKAELGFGIHSNCIISSVSNERKQNKDNEIVKRNGYTLFSQLDSENKIIAEKEVSWFDLDSTADLVYENFFSQLEQMTNIVDTIIVPTEKEDKWANFFSAVLEDLKIEENADSIKEALKTKKTCEKLMSNLVDGYAEILQDYIGDNCPKLKVKLVFDKSGKYVQMPRYGNVIELDGQKESTLSISNQEEEFRQKSLNSTKPQSLSTAKISNI